MKNILNYEMVSNAEEMVSYEKVMQFDGKTGDLFQQMHIDMVKSGEYKFFATGDSNWDYYIKGENQIYSIAKEEGCKSTYYGDLRYYKRRKGIR